VSTILQQAYSVACNLPITSSVGFGSNSPNLTINFRLLKLAFASPNNFNPNFKLAWKINLLTHYTKGTLFFTQLLHKIQFHALFHSRFPGSFHPSFTVLFALSVIFFFLVLDSGLPLFNQALKKLNLLKKHFSFCLKKPISL